MSFDTTVETHVAGQTAGGLDISVEIHYDECPESPRDMYDNVGTIVHWHRGYDLGEDVRSILEDPRMHSLAYFERYLSLCRDAAIILPISMLDHSGVTIWVAARRGEESQFDPGGWDSGQVGYIYCTREQVREEWGGDLDKAESYLRGEITEYDAYLRGEVYYYVVVDEDGETLESCGGFIGCMDECKSQGIDAAEGEIARLDREAEDEARNREDAAKLGIPTVDA